MFNFTVGLVNMIKSNKKIYYKKNENSSQEVHKKAHKGLFWFTEINVYNKSVL